MKYLKIFTDFISTLDELKDDEAGRLFRAMLKYAEDGTEPALSGNERYAWGFARLTIDRTRAYSDTKADAGRAGGLAKSSKVKQSLAEPSKAKQTVANPSLKEKKGKEIETLSKESVKKFVKPTLEEVRAYCKERGNNVNPEAFYSKNESKGWVVGKAPMKDWKAAVRYWETTGYDKPKQQSQYSNEELEKFEVDLLKGDFSF